MHFALDLFSMSRNEQNFKENNEYQYKHYRISGKGETISVRRCITIKEFLTIVPLSESEIRHNKQRYSHLMVKIPARKILFDAVKVSAAIQNVVVGCYSL